MSHNLLIGCIVASAFLAAGTLLVVFARPLAKLSVWWQSLWTRVPRLKWLSDFAIDQRTTIVIIRVVGVSFLVLGPLALVLAIALPPAHPPH
jgi:hypothetical protein